MTITWKLIDNINKHVYIACNKNKKWILVNHGDLYSIQWAEAILTLISYFYKYRKNNHKQKEQSRF